MGFKNLQEKLENALILVFKENVWLEKPITSPLSMSSHLETFFALTLQDYLAKVDEVFFYVLINKLVRSCPILVQLGRKKAHINVLINRSYKQTDLIFNLFRPGWPGLLSAAFWKIITALKSHMTCYNLNLNSLQN